MATEHYLVKKVEGGYVSTPTHLLKDPASIRLVDHPIRVKMLKLLSQTPMYPAEMARKLRMHEQKVYYHLKQMSNTGIVEVVEKKDVRGTTAKKFGVKDLSFSVTLGDEWHPFGEKTSHTTDPNLERFLHPFLEDGRFTSKIVVGSPDPHGPLKASARDGHYAIDLALFLGRYCELPKDFSVALDVDINARLEERDLIVVGGPVTNMVARDINQYLPVKFSDAPPWGLTSTRTGKVYTSENTGLIARIPNPYHKNSYILYLAGIRGVGTKSAVLALSRHYKAVLQTYGEQRSWVAVVQGFDLDGDGKIDSIEIAE